MSDKPRPRAFKLDPMGEGLSPDAHVRIDIAPDFYAEESAKFALPADELAVEVAQKRGMAARALLSWGGLFWSALGGLVSLALGLWVDSIVEGLFARAPALGWVALALAGLAGFALIVMGSREIRAIWRQQRIAKLHQDLASARAADDQAAGRDLVGSVANIYTDRPELKAAVQEVRRLTTQIIDGRDLIDLAERELMSLLDARAKTEIATAAKRVSVITAISPRAIIDLLFVMAQTIRLIRRLSEIYGGRPGFFGFLRLARSVGAHLALTGGMAVGDSLVQQVVGHGIAAKLSARLGEGVLNGLLTTRVGLSAMAVCRPMPYGVRAAPRIAEVAPFLFGQGRGPKTPDPISDDD